MRQAGLRRRQAGGIPCPSLVRATVRASSQAVQDYFLGAPKRGTVACEVSGKRSRRSFLNPTRGLNLETRSQYRHAHLRRCWFGPVSARCMTCPLACTAVVKLRQVDRYSGTLRRLISSFPVAGRNVARCRRTRTALLQVNVCWVELKRRIIGPSRWPGPITGVAIVSKRRLNSQPRALRASVSLVSAALLLFACGLAAAAAPQSAVAPP